MVCALLQIRWHLIPIELPVQSFNPRAKYEAYNLPYCEYTELNNIMKKKKRNYPDIVGGQKLEKEPEGILIIMHC
jgi:hypothetical protein